MSSATSPASPELRPVTVGELTRLMADRGAARGSRLQIVGGRTCLRGVTSGPPEVENLITTELSRIIDYPARDLTITVESGVRVQELQRVLKEQGQTLPIDIPECRRATIGGAIACNTSGPGRYGYGTLRDYVIGIRAVDGRGRLFAAGGRVVKNVAGYDLCKLLTGSRGRLAAIAEVTLKLRPLPESRRLVWMQCPDFAVVEAALAKLVSSATRPVAVEVFNSQAAQHITREAQLALPDQGPVVCVGFDGTERETRWQVDVMCAELPIPTGGARELIDPDDASELWNGLTEYCTASDEPLTFQAVVPPSRVVDLVQRATEQDIAVQSHAANGVVIGHLSDRCTEPQQAAHVLGALQQFITSAGGSLTISRCDPEWWGRLHEFRRPALTLLERELKRTLDPYDLFVD